MYFARRDRCYRVLIGASMRVANPNNERLQASATDAHERTLDAASPGLAGRRSKRARRDVDRFSPELPRPSPRSPRVNTPTRRRSTPPHPLQRAPTPSRRPATSAAASPLITAFDTGSDTSDEDGPADPAAATKYPSATVDAGGDGNNSDSFNRPCDRAGSPSASGPGGPDGGGGGSHAGYRSPAGLSRTRVRPWAEPTPANSYNSSPVNATHTNTHTSTDTNTDTNTNTNTNTGTFPAFGGGEAGRRAAPPLSRRTAHAAPASGGVAAAVADTDASAALGETAPPPQPPTNQPANRLTWVECENCGKWRSVPYFATEVEVPSRWTCALHRNPALRSCAASEEPLPLALDSDVAMTTTSTATDPAGQPQQGPFCEGLDCLLQIFKHLHGVDLCRARRVSRYGPFVFFPPFFFSREISQRAPLRAHAHWVLLGAGDPTAWPLPGVRFWRHAASHPMLWRICSFRGIGVAGWYNGFEF